MRTNEITLAEIDEQDVELLPARAALGGFHHHPGNWASVYATNQALALNAGSHFSHAVAHANQTIFVAQG